MPVEYEPGCYTKVTDQDLGRDLQIAEYTIILRDVFYVIEVDIQTLKYPLA